MALTAALWSHTESHTYPVVLRIAFDTPKWGGLKSDESQEQDTNGQVTARESNAITASLVRKRSALFVYDHHLPDMVCAKCEKVRLIVSIIRAANGCRLETI